MAIVFVSDLFSFCRKKSHCRQNSPFVSCYDNKYFWYEMLWNCTNRLYIVGTGILRYPLLFISVGHSDCEQNCRHSAK